MADTQTVRLFNGKILGFIKTQPNGDKIVTSFYGKQLGRYEKRHDRTVDWYGRIIGKGDLTGLLFNENI